MSELTAEVSARELTMLAWRRTALRWVVVAVVAARIFTDTVGRGRGDRRARDDRGGRALSLAAARASLPDARGTSPVRLGIVAVGTLALGVVALVWVLVAIKPVTIGQSLLHVAMRRC